MSAALSFRFFSSFSYFTFVVFDITDHSYRLIKQLAALRSLFIQKIQGERGCTVCNMRSEYKILNHNFHLLNKVIVILMIFVVIVTLDWACTDHCIPLSRLCYTKKETRVNFVFTQVVQQTCVSISVSVRTLNMMHLHVSRYMVLVARESFAKPDPHICNT